MIQVEALAKYAARLALMECAAPSSYLVTQP